MTGPVDDDVERARALLRAAGGAVGTERMSDGEVELCRIALLLRALTHAVLATVPGPAETALDIVDGPRS